MLEFINSTAYVPQTWGAANSPTGRTMPGIHCVKAAVLENTYIIRVTDSRENMC